MNIQGLFIHTNTHVTLTMTQMNFIQARLKNFAKHETIRKRKSTDCRWNSICTLFFHGIKGNFWRNYIHMK